MRYPLIMESMHRDQKLSQEVLGSPLLKFTEFVHQVSKRISEVQFRDVISPPIGPEMSHSLRPEQSWERRDTPLFLPDMQTDEAILAQQKSSPLLPPIPILPILPFPMQQQTLPRNYRHFHLPTLLRIRLWDCYWEVEAGSRIDETGRPGQVIIQQQDRPNQCIRPPNLPPPIGRSLLPLLPGIQFDPLAPHLQTVQSSCLTPSVRRGEISCNLDLVLAIEGMGRGRRACFGLSRKEGFLFEGRSIPSALYKELQRKKGKAGIWGYYMQDSDRSYRTFPHITSIANNRMIHTHILVSNTKHLT